MADATIKVYNKPIAPPYVRNSEQLLYDGPASTFIEENDGDEEIADLVDEAIRKGTSSKAFFSGIWRITCAK